MNIAVFGLGYVGMVNIACLTQLGHATWGCDIKGFKVDLVKQGKSPIYEPGVDDMLEEGMQKKLIHASTNASEVIAHTDMALICVGTPSMANGTVNLDYTLNTTREIAKSLKKEKRKYTIVYRSTIPPGTVEEHFIPLLQQELGDDMAHLTVAFIPEFLREGSAVKDFFHCSRIVVGSNEEEPALVKEVFSYSKDIPLVFTSFRTAEYVKYVDNAFHALKIAFANEAYRIGSAYDIDIEAANRIFLMDTHLNISPVYLRPGLPFGGSCLPKDMRAIQHLAERKQIVAPLLGSVIPSNEKLQRELFSRLRALKLDRITLYGLTFKSGTDDVRESPMLHLARELAEAGVDLTIYDPDIREPQLVLDHPWIKKHLEKDEKKAFSHPGGIVICKKNFANYIGHISPSAVLINYFNQERFDVPNEQLTLY